MCRRFQQKVSRFSPTTSFACFTEKLPHYLVCTCNSLLPWSAAFVPLLPSLYYYRLFLLYFLDRVCKSLHSRPRFCARRTGPEQGLRWVFERSVWMEFSVHSGSIPNMSYTCWPMCRRKTRQAQRHFFFSVLPTKIKEKNIRFTLWHKLSCQICTGHLHMHWKAWHQLWGILGLEHSNLICL